jgi:hypothetical protein
MAKIGEKVREFEVVPQHIPAPHEAPEEEPSRERESEPARERETEKVPAHT